MDRSRALNDTALAEAACAMEARFLHGELSKHFQRPVFLDSDNLRDLNELLAEVRQSSVMTILQSAELLQRPWCLLGE